jgi:threonine/homoserine/homoserine lactone efflux protein
MIEPTKIALFLVAALTLNVTPGPDMIYITARSLGQGRKAGFVSALGVGVGSLAAAIGLSALLMSSAIAYTIVKYIGAGYLIYLGLRMILSKASDRTQTTLVPASLKKIFLQAIATSVLNPKVALFFIAFLPQFASPTLGNIAWQIAFLGTLFCLTATAVNIIVALLSGSIGDRLRDRPRFSQLQQKFTGGIFVSLGTSLALPERK